MNKLIDKVLNIFNFISWKYINEKKFFNEIIITFVHQLNLTDKEIVIDLYYLVNNIYKI